MTYLKQLGVDNETIEHWALQRLNTPLEIKWGFYTHSLRFSSSPKTFPIPMS